MFFWRKRRPPVPEYLVFGLGNPGPRYAGTRHNLGWWLLDLLAEQAGVERTLARHRSQVDYCRLADVPAALIKPTTLMNRSGQSVASWLGELPQARFVVVADDISLKAGKARLRRQGSAGGHRGLASIIETLGTDEFDRLKLGIGAQPPETDSADYVLEEPADVDRPLIDAMLKRAARAVHALARDDFKQALELLALKGES